MFLVLIEYVYKEGREWEVVDNGIAFETRDEAEKVISKQIMTIGRANNFTVVEIDELFSPEVCRRSIKTGRGQPPERG